MRYYKGYIALSDACDVPVLLHIRNARAICFDQLFELMSLEMIAALSRSLRWRVARLEKAGLIARLEMYRHFGKPVFGITQQGLECLESRGHYLLSLPSDTDQILHSSQIPHALELVNIRIALAKAGLLHSWKCELEITSRNLVVENAITKDYDAIAEIEVDGVMQRLAIEYERNPKASARYRAIREVIDKDETTNTVLYLTSNDDILYLLAIEMRSSRKRIGFALSESFRRSLLDTRTLTNTANSEVVLLRDLLVGQSS
jgi:DNA-binding Lrp family transcriptional regulator